MYPTMLEAKTDANSAIARLVRPGDLLVFFGYAMVAEPAAGSFQLKVVLVDQRSRIRGGADGG